MIKMMVACDRASAAISDDTFYSWWFDVHGREIATLPGVRRYVQTHTLPEVRSEQQSLAHWNSTLKSNPTRDGLGLTWWDDFEAVREGHRVMAQRRPEWSESLFDRQSMDVVIGREHVVVEGLTTPDMVKGVYIFERRPDLGIEEFQDHWLNVHGPLWAAVPGVRRYVQTHALPEAYTTPYDATGTRVITHDGLSEVWFDDLDALRHAVASPEREAASADGSQILEYSTMSIVIGTDRWVVR